MRAEGGTGVRSRGPRVGQVSQGLSGTGIRIDVRGERRPNLLLPLLPQRNDDNAPLLINLEAALRRLNRSEELALKREVAHADAHAPRTKPDGHVRATELLDKLSERQVELDG